VLNVVVYVVVVVVLVLKVVVVLVLNTVIVIVLVDLVVLAYTGNSPDVSLNVSKVVVHFICKWNR
jgi:hypothetical protein